MKKVATLIGLSVLALGVVGCGGNSSDPSNDNGGAEGFRIVNIDYQGRNVPCIQYDGYDNDPIDCDWDMTRPISPATPK